MSNDKFTIHYTKCRVTKDYAGNSCILVYYDYTNNGSSPSSAMVDVNLQATQNGQALEAAILAENDTAVDQFMAEVNPGADCKCLPGIYTQGSVRRNDPGRRSFHDWRWNSYISDSQSSVN